MSNFCHVLFCRNAQLKAITRTRLPLNRLHWDITLGRLDYLL